MPIGLRAQRFAVAPAYLAEHGRPDHPKDLLNHACIRHRFAHGVTLVPTGPLIATTMELEVAAAIAGLGIVSSFEDYLAPTLASGALEPVLEDWWQSFSGPFLYYPPPPYARAAARLHRFSEGASRQRLSAPNLRDSDVRDMLS